jgi:hypothetical protein
MQALSPRWAVLALDQFFKQEPPRGGSDGAFGRLA